MTFNEDTPGAEEARQLATLLGDRYQIVRLLGRGGMGTVFVARDRRLHRSVAIKTLRAEYAADPARRSAFLREARMTAHLQHDGVVPVLDALEGDRTVAVIMPFAGQSLDQVIELAGGRLTGAKTAEVLARVADILTYVHRMGILHRDVKPANVLVERERGAWRVRLTDFGIAVVPLRDYGREGVPGPAGSPGFMAPEQMMNQLEADVRSDVYALGVLGYLMCTGEMPFGDATGAARLSLQFAGRFVPLRVAAPNVPRHLARAIERCLHPDPAKRWRNAADVRDACRVSFLRRAAGAILRTLSPLRTPEATSPAGAFAPGAV
jgi:eukaryotic-like serine/threonine-protein kinase